MPTPSKRHAPYEQSQTLGRFTAPGRLMHEYMCDASDFVAALAQAGAATLMLIDTYNRLTDDLPRRLTIDDSRLPAGLS